MELENSKRVSLKASYVEIELTQDEQQEMSDVPALGLEKANFVRNLALTNEDVTFLRQRGEGMAGILGVFEQARRWDSGNLALAGQLARIPNDYFLELGRALAERREDAVTPFLTAHFARQVRIAPVGRLHLERIEMVPAGTERGELIYTVPLTPKETVTVSHKEGPPARTSTNGSCPIRSKPTASAASRRRPTRPCRPRTRRSTAALSNSPQ
jgi:hypothetical protein